jgi:Regulator of ribonuclease activity B
MPDSRSNDAIQHFWEKFVEHKDILAVPDKKKEEEMQAVLNSLRCVDPRLYYHVGFRDEGPDFLLSAEGHYDLSSAIAECISQAPFCAGWRFRPILDSESLFGQRNHSLFPPDENGDVLFRIAARGGDLITPKEVDFCHVFPSECAARSFASGLLESDAIAIQPYDRTQGFTWEVRVTRTMHPTHHNITAHEAHLAALAKPHEGRPDGWGFMST